MSTNQGKLDVVNKELARVNINISGISELKWMRTGKLNPNDHYTYYCGQESLRRNGVAIIVNKRLQNAVLGGNLKNDRMISLRFQGKLFSITVIQVYAPTTNAEEDKVEWFYEEQQDLQELTPQKEVLFIIVDWNSTDKFSFGVPNKARQRILLFSDTTQRESAIRSVQFRHSVVSNSLRPP